MAGPRGRAEGPPDPARAGASERGWGRVSIPADANPADNDFWFVFDAAGAAAGDRRGRDAAGRPAAPAGRGDRARPGRRSARPRWSRPTSSPASSGTRSRCCSGRPRCRRATRPKPVRAFVERGGRAIFFPPRVAGATASSSASAGRPGQRAEGRGRRSRAGGAIRTCWPTPRAARRCRSGSSRSAGAAGSGGRAHAAGDPQGRRAAPGAGRRPTRGGVYFCATTPARGDSSLATDGVVLYVLVQRALAAGAAVLGSTRQLVGRRARRAMTPRSWKRAGGRRGGDLDRIPAPPRRLRRGRPAARREPAGRGGLGRRSWPTAAWPSCSSGLDFARVDDRAGSVGSLIQEIWRLFLVAMMVAMVVEAGLCLPKPARPRGSRVMSVSRSLTFLWTPWSLAAVDRRRAGHGRVLLRRLAAERLPAARSGCSNCCGSALVALVAVLLNQPEWVEEYRPEEKPSIAVLWDASPSMETRDVVAADQPTAAADDPARGDRAAGRAGDLGPAPRADERRHPAVLARRRPGTAPTCTSRSPRRPRRSRTCAGSCWPPTATGTRARRRSRPPPGCGSKGVPVFAVPVGQPDAAARRRAPQPRRPDLRRRRQVGPRSRSRSTARCRASTSRPSRSGRPTATRSPRKSGSPPMGRTSDWLVWKPKATGDFTLTLDGPQARRRDRWPTTTRCRRRSRSARRSCGSWSSSRTRAGSIATCGMPSRATRASSSRACSSTRA